MPDAATPFLSQRKNRRRSAKIDWLPAIFLVVAILFLPAGGDSAASNSLAIVSVSTVLEAIWFMLLGLLIGGLIEVFVSR